MATQNTKSKSQAEEKRSVVVPPGRMRLMEHAHNSWSITAEQGTTLDDIKKSVFWSLCCEKFRPADFVTVIANDMSWLAQGFVQSSARTWAQVHFFNVVKMEEAVSPDTNSEFKVEWKGPEMLWCVIRLSDQVCLQDRLENARAANQWMSEHERRVA